MTLGEDARQAGQGKKPIPEFQDKLASASTRGAYLAFIRSLLCLAVDWGWLIVAPKVVIPRQKNKRVRWLTKDEADSLIRELPAGIKQVVMFALATGLRRNNIIRMEWSKIDMSRRVAWVHPDQTKAGKAIGIALNDTACQVLKGQIGKHPRMVFVHCEEAIGPDKKPRKAYRPMRVNDNWAFNAAKKRAGIDNYRFHDLRHTWASWLVQAGVPVSVVQKMGGWGSIEMVQRYAHLAPAHLSEHAKQIDKILGGYGTNMAQNENGPAAVNS